MKLPLVSRTAPLSLLAFASLTFAPSLAHAQDGTPFFTQPAPLDVPRAQPAPAPAAPSQTAEAPQTPDASEAPVRPVQFPPIPMDPPKPADLPAPRFGERDEIVVTGSAGLSASSTQWDSSDAKRWSVGGALSFHYFIVNNVSLGLDFEGSYGITDGYGADGSLVETKSTLVSGGPMVGFNVPMSGRFSFWPQATLGIHERHQEVHLVSGTSLSVASNAVGSPSTTQTGPWTSVYLPLLFHPAPHFFIGFGPTIYHDFARTQGGPDVGGELTTMGADLTVGGWWGGPEVTSGDASPGATAAPVARAPRFGDLGTVVLTTALGLSGNWASYSGTSSTSSTIAVSPSADWFVADHVSLGAAISYVNSDTKAVQPDGPAIETTDARFGLSLRLGADVPLGNLFSWYPRAGIGFGGETYDSRSAAGEAKDDTTYSWAYVDAPVLAHVAPHFFVGLGPAIAHDLSRTDQYGRSNQGTTLSASGSVGGWF